ncbi:IS1380 family transposase [Desulfobacterales bacterium HSG17]|nr:IS1380 family transposase [Desulfobacterales bacterium HSG17]
MVKSNKSKKRKNRKYKGFKRNPVSSKKIKASTPYDTCTEQLSPFGGVLALIKFFDLIGFKAIFNLAYIGPSRKPKLGHYNMIVGVLMLLFIGFNRLWHFSYLRLDAMLCGFFQLTRLPVASTFWRYVNSLGINQANALIHLMALMRQRAWQLSDLNYSYVRVDIDTTVETLFGNQQGGRKGHNTKNRGKKGYRPVLCFIEQSREYLVGNLRKGETISGKETAALIKKVRRCLPECVHEVLIRADGEFQSWASVQECISEKVDFIIANKRCNPIFDPKGWYQPKKRKLHQYNSCIYQPQGWGQPCRFVVMRIPLETKNAKGQGVQLPLFEDDQYKYRIFCTSLKRKAHKVIREYDKRADVENLVGECKREGLDAIPSAQFKSNYAYFQIVMLAYNIWRYMKILAECSARQDSLNDIAHNCQGMKGIETNTVRIARLRLLMISAKVVTDSNRDKVRYSVQDSRTQGLFCFLEYLDMKRKKPRPWVTQVVGAI